MPLYGLTVKRQWDAPAKIDWDSATIKCSLHTATYTPNVDTHDFWSAVTNEVTGTAYTTGGATLATPTVTYDTGTDETRLDAADAVWTTATIASIRYAVVYEDTAGASTTDPLVSYYDLGAQSVTAATFTVQWDATGVAKWDST